MNEIFLLCRYNRYFVYLNMKCEHDQYLAHFVTEGIVDLQHFKLIEHTVVYNRDG